jgi:hypothetical protein
VHVLNEIVRLAITNRLKETLTCHRNDFGRSSADAVRRQRRSRSDERWGRAGVLLRIDWMVMRKVR